MASRELHQSQELNRVTISLLNQINYTICNAHYKYLVLEHIISHKSLHQTCYIDKFKSREPLKASFIKPWSYTLRIVNNNIGNFLPRHAVHRGAQARAAKRIIRLVEKTSTRGRVARAPVNFNLAFTFAGLRVMSYILMVKFKLCIIVPVVWLNNTSMQLYVNLCLDMNLITGKIYFY